MTLRTWTLLTSIFLVKASAYVFCLFNSKITVLFGSFYAFAILWYFFILSKTNRGKSGKISAPSYIFLRVLGHSAILFPLPLFSMEVLVLQLLFIAHTFYNTFLEDDVTTKS